MTDTDGWTVVIHLSLILATIGYAKFLNLKWVYEWYHPDRTILAVIGGVLLIGIALAAECAIGTLPWNAFVLYFTLNSAAGGPIARWQYKLARKRRQDAEAIDRRD